MASLTQWTWVWVNSRSWWWTGRPGVLRFMGSWRVGHYWATELMDLGWFWCVCAGSSLVKEAQFWCAMLIMGEDICVWWQEIHGECLYLPFALAESLKLFFFFFVCLLRNSLTAKQLSFCLPMQMVRVWSLVWELRSCMSHRGEKKKKENRSNTETNSIKF